MLRGGLRIVYIVATEHFSRVVNIFEHAVRAQSTVQLRFFEDKIYFFFYARYVLQTGGEPEKGYENSVAAHNEQHLRRIWRRI